MCNSCKERLDAKMKAPPSRAKWDKAKASEKLRTNLDGYMKTFQNID